MKTENTLLNQLAFNGLNSLKINLSEIVISPKFSIKEPIELKAKKAVVETNEVKAEIYNLNF